MRRNTEEGIFRMDERVMEFVNALVGRQLISLCCEAEILDFGFGEQ